MIRNLIALIAVAFFSIDSMHAIIIPSFPYNEQTDYRWRNDNGSETGATWKATINTPITITNPDLDQPLRLRYGFYNSGDDLGTIPNSLQYSSNGGVTWTNITTVGTTNHWRYVTSPHVIHESSTSGQLGSILPFTLGKIISTTTAGAITLGSGMYSENEYLIQSTNQILENTQYLFRVSGLDEYNDFGTINTECIAKITTVADAEICSPGTSVVLTASGLTSNTITWYDAEDNIVGTGNSFTTPSLSESITYYAEANGESGTCPSEKIAVSANVSLIDIIPNDNFVCGSGQVNLSVTHTPTAAVINWYSDPEATILLHTGTSFVTPPITSTTQYYVTGSTPGCTSLPITVTATVRPLPVAEITPIRDTICGDEMATFTASSNTNFTYDWSNGETTNAMSTNEYGDHILTITDITTTCNTILNVFLDTAINVTVEGFDFIPLIHTDYKTVSFYPINDIGATDYLWNFGDGNTSTERTPTHTFADSGEYFVKLHLSNACSEDSSSLDIFVLPSNTSIEDAAWDNQVSVYPNPTNDQVYIKVNMAEKISNISVYNIAGQILINQSTLLSQEAQISLAQLPKGQYFILVTSENEKHSIKQITLQ